MTTIYQRAEDGTYHEIVSALPVRSCGRFVVHVNRRGQWPVEYGFVLDGERLCWTRPEMPEERAAREAEVARIEAQSEAAYQMWLDVWIDWQASKLGHAPELPEAIEAPRDGRVVRDVVAALEQRGENLGLADWNQVRVLDL